MKFLTTPYHYNLLNDLDRLSVFYEGINDYFNYKKPSKDCLIFDIGCGSGILTYFIRNNTNSKIIAIEKYKKAFETAKQNLKELDNIELINEDILNLEFDKKANLVICEMLDTALIDEEEVLAINHIQNFLKNDFQIIPEGIINIAELVKTDREYIHYEDDSITNNYEVLSNSIKYSVIDFSKRINPKFKGILEFKIKKDSIINGIKITSFTKIFKNIISGPTSMMNPSLFIPLKEKKVYKNNIISIDLEYSMGQGIKTIKTNFR
ncbi:MAG: methyltransferase domain-containing protein [Methanobacteriaceae archaeon]|jgi:predicted RNA methylase|nr:methyltransferase domain-containing protein [Methanobacteriaceae archaeon]